jgi:hypothetical protein
MGTPGRKSKYNPEFHIKDLAERMREGAKDCWIWAEWGVCKDTFYAWLREYPELKETHERGLAECEKWWEAKGIELMKAGDNKAFSYWIAFMRRKFGGVWVNPDAHNAQTTHININQMNVLQHKSPTELVEFINQGLSYLRYNNVLEADFKVLEEKPHAVGYERSEESQKDS